MERKKENKPPEFQSFEEEKEYWEARGPLAEGRNGRINKPKSDQKRSSFLSVRLTGEEITALHEVAAIFYTTPSEFARGAILDSVERFKSLYERDQKERERLEEALRKMSQSITMKPLGKSSLLESLRNRTQGQRFKSEQVVSFGDELTINLATHEVFLSGKQVNLTPTEYYLLENLIVGSDKSISISIQELDNRLSHPGRVTK